MNGGNKVAREARPGHQAVLQKGLRPESEGVSDPLLGLSGGSVQAGWTDSVGQTGLCGRDRRVQGSAKGWGPGVKQSLKRRDVAWVREP